MRKVFIILFVFIFMCQPVFSYAGRSSEHSSHTLSHISTCYQGTLLIAGAYLMKRLDWKCQMHQEMTDDLETAYQQDVFWNEKEEQYFNIQKAWSKQDLTIQKLCLSDTFYKRWQQYQNQKNVLNNDQDCFWVDMEGKMNDTLVEYWKFIRYGYNILLDEMKQQDGVES